MLKTVEELPADAEAQLAKRFQFLEAQLAVCGVHFDKPWATRSVEEQQAAIMPVFRVVYAMMHSTSLLHAIKAAREDEKVDYNLTSYSISTFEQLFAAACLLAASLGAMPQEKREKTIANALRELVVLMAKSIPEVAAGAANPDMQSKYEQPPRGTLQ